MIGSKLSRHPTTQISSKYLRERAGIGPFLFESNTCVDSHSLPGV